MARTSNTMLKRDGESGHPYLVLYFSGTFSTIEYYVSCGLCCDMFPLIISHQSEWLLSKILQAINAGEGVEKREPSYTVGGNAN